MDQQETLMNEDGLNDEEGIATRTREKADPPASLPPYSPPP